MAARRDRSHPAGFCIVRICVRPVRTQNHQPVSRRRGVAIRRLWRTCVVLAMRCYRRGSKSGRLAMLAATRRASSRVIRFSASRLPGSDLVHVTLFFTTTATVAAICVCRGHWIVAALCSGVVWISEGVTALTAPALAPPAPFGCAAERASWQQQENSVS